MRVAITYTGCHRRGGVERVMYECVNFLGNRGHDVHAFSSDWENDASLPNITRHTIRTQRTLPPFRVPRFVRDCRAHYGTLSPRANVTAGFGVATLDESVVWMQSVHAAWIEISQSSRPLLGRLKQRLNPFHPVILKMEEDLVRKRRYRKLVALTPQVRNDLMRLYAVPLEDIVVIPNGFAPTDFNVERTRTGRESMRSQFAFANEDKVIAFVANELERKGFFPLLEAMTLCNEKRLKLLAIGRLNKEECAPALSRFGLENRVHFTGATNDPAKFLSAADAFVLPTYYEAWGLVIVESLACGIPVLTSRSAGAAVAVREGKTGFLLDDPKSPAEIADKLDRLFQTELLEAEQISNSVQEYQWESVLNRYETVLQQSAN